MAHLMSTEGTPAWAKLLLQETTAIKLEIAQRFESLDTKLDNMQKSIQSLTKENAATANRVSNAEKRIRKGGMIRTMNSMDDLEDSGFGVPRPRHGLQLLHWFARKYIQFDDYNEMQVEIHPDQGDFGFHPFQNRLEYDDYSYITLLPEIDYPYYEVGNLHLPTSSSLPPYVRKNFPSQQDSSNKDRIIISMCQGLQVDKVYVTQHDGMSFDHENTFRITRGLLMSICQMTVDDFLHEANYYI